MHIEPTKKRGATVWNGLNRATAWLYAVIIHSWLGRLMTGYRQADRALLRGRACAGSRSCKPMSPARLRVVKAVESSRLLAGLRALFRGLFTCPMAFYGLFGMIYGLAGLILFFVLRFAYPALAPDIIHAVESAVVALLSLPLLFSHKSLADALGSSPPGRLIFVTFLGVPRDRMNPSGRKLPAVTPYLFILLALGGAAASLFIGPLTVPAILLGVGVLGMIFTYPEAGVVLSTAMLPVIWLNSDTVWVLAALILLTWCSYGVKLLFLHRTIRFGLLDVTVLIFGGLVLLSGMTGATVTADTVAQGVLLFVCLSDYFLIVNLMTTRAYIRRCLVGVAVSVALVTLLSCLRSIPVDIWQWLEGSRGGDVVIAAFTDLLAYLTGLWEEHAELFPVLMFPWLYAYFLHAQRLSARVLWGGFIVLNAFLVLRSGSVGAVVCVLCGLMIFFLLLGHQWLSVGIALLPALGCGVFWLTYLYPLSELAGLILSGNRWYRGMLRQSLWQMVGDHPAGIGLGEDCFAAVYPAYAAPGLGGVTDFHNLYFELLLGLGWAGLCLFVVLVFFFVQKGLTCLRHTSAVKDRAMILGGIASVACALIFGTVRSFITAPRIFFTVFLVIALCSAYENIIFDESDVLMADTAGHEYEADRIYRRGA